MSQPKLPYQMPESVSGKIRYLCDLMDLKQVAVAGLHDDKACRILTDVVLYHHLDRFDKLDVMKRVNSLPGRQRQMLTEKILLPIVNPYWGLWALSTAELRRQYDYFDAIDTLGAFAGISFSAASGWDVVKKLRQAGKGGLGKVFVTVGIWGFYWMNASTKSMILDELFRRTNEVR